jgi:hypothetical protein
LDPFPSGIHSPLSLCLSLSSCLTRDPHHRTLDHLIGLEFVSPRALSDVTSDSAIASLLDDPNREAVVSLIGADMRDFDKYILSLNLVEERPRGQDSEGAHNQSDVSFSQGGIGRAQRRVRFKCN